MKIPTRFLLISLTIFASAPLFCAEKAIIGARFSHKETSEAISMNSYQLGGINHRRDLFWPYADEEVTSQDLGVIATLNPGSSREYDFEGQKLGLSFGKKYSDKAYFTLQAGFHRVKGTSAREEIVHSSPSLESSLKLKSDKTNHKFSLDYDLSYEDLQLPAGINQNLRTLGLRYYFSHSFAKNQKIYTSIGQKFYSGSNSRTQADSSYMIKPSESEWMPWFGFGFEYLSTSKNVTGYWTPRNQTSYGPRFEWSYWQNQYFSSSFGSQVNRYYDSSAKKSGWGHYTALSFYLGDRDQMHGEIEFVRMDSTQEGGKWHENDLNLSFNYPF